MKGLSVPAQVEILDEGHALAMALPDGRQPRFHAVWLRDNAWDETTRAPGNKQKLIALRDIPMSTRICRNAARG